MKTISSFIFVVNIIISIPAKAQKFWFTKNEFRGGPKTAITLINNSIFFVSTTSLLKTPMEICLPSQVFMMRETEFSSLPNDSVYLSFIGSGGNFGIELNIFKSIHDIDNVSLWKILDIKHYTVSGMDDALNNIYITQNGDWYSSINESVRNGGTCYSKHGKNWVVLNYGLGADIYSRRNEQYFAETSSGRIFMNQYIDERIYKTDTSIVTSTKHLEFKTDSSQCKQCF